MKTAISALIALGLLSTAAAADWCAPGYGYGQRTSYGYSYGHHRPSYTLAPRVIEQAPQDTPAPVAPPAPIEPAPLPEQQAPEVAPAK